MCTEPGCCFGIFFVSFAKMISTHWGEIDCLILKHTEACSPFNTKTKHSTEEASERVRHPNKREDTSTLKSQRVYGQGWGQYSDFKKKKRSEYKNINQTMIVKPKNGKSIIMIHILEFWKCSQKSDKKKKQHFDFKLRF